MTVMKLQSMVSKCYTGRLLKTKLCDFFDFLVINETNVPKNIHANSEAPSLNPMGEKMACHLRFGTALWVLNDKFSRNP